MSIVTCLCCSYLIERMKTQKTNNSFSSTHRIHLFSARKRTIFLTQETGVLFPIFSQLKVSDNVIERTLFKNVLWLVFSRRKERRLSSYSPNIAERKRPFFYVYIIRKAHVSNVS